MKILSTIVMLVCGLSLSAMEGSKLDSLISAYELTVVDSVKMNIIQSIFAETIYKESKVAMQYSAHLLKLKNVPKANLQFHFNKALYFYITSKVDSSISELELALEQAEKLDDSEYIIEIQIKMSGMFLRVNNIEKAIEYVEKAHSQAKLANINSLIGESHIVLGSIFMQEARYQEALSNFLKVDSLAQFTEDQTYAANALSNVGIIYMKLKKFEKAELYLNKAGVIYEANNHSHGIFSVRTSQGRLYFETKNYTKAIHKLEGALDYYLNSGNTYNQAECYMYMGSSYYELGQKLKAVEMLNKAIQLNNKNNDGVRNLDPYLILGEYYLELNDLGKSRDCLRVVLNLADEDSKISSKSKALFLLSKLNSKENNNQEAFVLMKQHLEIEDSLTQIGNEEGLNEIEAKYQTEKKEREIAFLKSQKEIALQQRENQRNMLLGGIGITSIASLFFFFLYRNRQKTNQKLKEIDQAKSTFFTNISHEFRTPLTLIKGPIQEQLSRVDLSEETRNKFEMIDRNSDRLLNLVDQTLNISKLESGSIKLNLICEDLNSFIGTLTDAFSFAAKEKSINYKVVMNHDDAETCFDRDAIEKVITNLISNAIKYTPSDGEINISSKIEKGMFHFAINNSGIGLNKNELNQVFERFYQVNNSKEGVGVGLSLVKDLVKLHHGEIKVTSKEKEWVEFELEIPVKSTNGISKGSEKPNFETINATLPENDTDELIDSKLPILLIVEDNEDVRFFVKSIFEKRFQIIEAENGVVGVELAIENIPDVIISDVMMPEKDGVALSAELKINQITSHIPIILLTAKVGDENELEGIKSGADDYITKPFNVDLLKSKVDNLLENRRKIRARYSQELFVKPKDIAVTSADEELLIKIQSIMDEKMADGNFTVEVFSSEVGMSRMQLHRKLKAITGLSASEFIRSQRIKQAAILLQSTDKNVSEIGYAVGFNDHAYFSKCFKDVFKVSPSEYSSKNT